MPPGRLTKPGWRRDAAAGFTLRAIAVEVLVSIWTHLDDDLLPSDSTGGHIVLLGQKRQYLFSEEREGMEASLISQKHEKTVVLGVGTLTQHDTTNLNAAPCVRIRNCV